MRCLATMYGMKRLGYAHVDQDKFQIPEASNHEANFDSASPGAKLPHCDGDKCAHQHSDCNPGGARWLMCMALHYLCWVGWKPGRDGMYEVAPCCGYSANPGMNCAPCHSHCSPVYVEPLYYCLSSLPGGLHPT